MEKQITLSDIYAKFTKDFDTFGKMDPYLQFAIGKTKAKTETAKSAGKEPKWKDQIVLNFFEDQTTILVTGYEEDTTSNDFMGQGKIDVKTLKANGEIEINIIQENGNQSGTVYCKYVLKTLSPVPLLVVKSLKCDFYKDTEFVLKTKPFFSVTTNGNTVATEPKEKGDARQLTWSETMRIKMKDGERISFCLEDSNDKKSKIFCYDAFPKEFRTTSGIKRFNVIDSSYEPLGTLELNYETQNFVSKEESAKTEEAAKKQSEELRQVRIESIKGNLNDKANDLYFKIVIGQNVMKTAMLEKAPKDFTMDVKQTLYSESTENKVVFAAYNEENVGGDTFYGGGEILLDNLVEGNNTVKLMNRRNQHFGDIIVNLSTKKLVNRQLTISDIKVKMGVSGDIIGKTDVYVVGKLGGSSSRTETMQGEDVKFTKDLFFRFSEEKQIKIQVMDEQLTKDEAMYTVNASLQDFKTEGEMQYPLIPEKYKEDKSKHGTLSFKYKTKNGIFKEKPKQSKKQQAGKKQQTKKQQPKKEQLKKPDPKKEQVKKEDPKKQEPKTEEKKVQQKAPSQKKMSVQQKAEEKIDPKAEKQLTISDMRAVYLKDFDTFGKMDPYATFKLGKQQQKTQTAHDSGKQCSWKATFTYKYYDDTSIEVKSYDEDVTSSDLMGSGKIQTKDLKSKGEFEIKIMSQKSQHVGTIYGKYVLKTLPLVPLLLITNAKCDFYKDTEFVLKTKPFFSVTTNGNTVATEPKEKGDARQLTWSETMRIKIKDGERISFCLEDSNDKKSKIFCYDAFPKEFRTTSGIKRFNVIDSSYEPLGTLELNYETQNFVSKEESAKTEEAAKKQSEELRQVRIESIKGNLNDKANDLYFKIVIGQNVMKTAMLEKAPKDFTMDVKQTLYSESTENKVVFAAYNEENVGGDTFYGGGEILLDNLVEGNNTVKLMNRQNKHFGDIIVNSKSKNVPCKQLIVSDMKIAVKESSDLIGDPELYVVGCLAGATRRTQTKAGKQSAYQKNLNFKYSEQNQLLLQIKDEDITKDDVVHQVKVNLDELKEKGQMKIPLIPQKYKDNKDKHGEFSFRYENKISQKNKVANKKQQPVQQKKQEPKKKEEPKKQQVKKEEVKKEQIKKQQPRKKEEEKKPLINEKKLEQSIVQKQSSLDKSRSNQSKLDRSKNSIKLPNINDSKNYGDKIFDKQSSSTLQKSIHVYSVPKANRFSGGPKYNGQPTFVMDSCFKTNSGKGAGFGFGNKRQFPDWMERNMKENPAPGAYFDHHATAHEFRARGPTFGLPYKYYQKVMIPKEKLANISFPQRKSPQKIIKR